LNGAPADGTAEAAERWLSSPARAGEAAF
jgi:hypothetical protein